MTFSINVLLNRARSAVAAIGTAAAIAGCGGGAESVGPDGLTQSDVNAMVRAMNTVGAFAFDLSLANAPDSPGLALQMSVRPLSAQYTCPGGGTILFGGSIETYYSGTNSAFVIEVEQKHAGCTTAIANGRTWTFEGDPSATLHTESVANSITHVVRMHGWFRGNFTWTSNDGLSGSCAADIKLSSNAAPAKNDPSRALPSGQIEGEFCGRSVDVHY